MGRSTWTVTKKGAKDLSVCLLREAAGAPGEEAALRQADAGALPVRGAAGPPEVAVAGAGAGAGVRTGALAHPVRRHDLPAGPGAAVQIEPGEAREVAGAHAQRVGANDRGGAGEIRAVL